MPAIWSGIVDRPIVYGGDDPSGFDRNMATVMPRWTACEMRLMAEDHGNDGMIPDDGDRERLTTMLGRPLHSFRETAVALTACRVDGRAGDTAGTPMPSHVRRGRANDDLVDVDALGLLQRIADGPRDRVRRQ